MKISDLFIEIEYCIPNRCVVFKTNSRRLFCFLQNTRVVNVGISSKRSCRYFVQTAHPGTIDSNKQRWVSVAFMNKFEVWLIIAMVLRGPNNRLKYEVSTWNS